jgi:hypothetical protein
MEQYWKTRPTADSSTSTQSAPDITLIEDASILSEYDRHRMTLLSNQAEDKGWQAELRRYLKDLPSNVMKDTDIVEWWQVCNPNMCRDIIPNGLQDNGSSFPTLRRISIDFLACQASSVPCERLFSGGGEIATKRRAQLGAVWFEELQVMKFAWRKNIGDLAAWNSAQVEDVEHDTMKEYQDLLAADQEQRAWDREPDEIVSCF